MPQIAELDPHENPNRSTAVWDGPTHGGYEDANLLELRAFVGPRAAYYLRKWLPRLDDPHDGQVGMNWVALLMPALWLGYRRMYRIAFLLTLGSVGLLFAQLGPVRRYP